jgi:hypothetical protein
MANRVMKVYLDEEVIPFVVGFSETADSGSNFDFGKSGGTPAGCFIDWMIMMPNHAYAPNEGPLIPSDLIRSHDAILSSILVNGEEIEGFSKDILKYDLSYEENSVPTLEVIPSSDLATYTIDTISSELSTTFSIHVLAQDDFSERTYEVSFTQTSSVEDLTLKGSVNIYPNPSNGTFVIQLQGEKLAKINIFDSKGRMLHHMQINELAHFRHKLNSGLYIVEVNFRTGKRIFKKIIVK